MNFAKACEMIKAIKTSNPPPAKPKPMQTPAQANWEQAKTNRDKVESDAKYSAALKEATMLYSSCTNKLGSRKIAAMMDRKYSLEGSTLNYETILGYTNKKLIGVSPEKRGPESKIPVCFWELLNCHISMAQMEGREKTKPRHLKVLIETALKNSM